MPTSTRALRPLERAVAARWVAARHRRPRAAAAKSRFLRFCRVCQTPCSPCAYRIARSRRSAVGALHHLAGPSAGSVQQRAGQPRARMSGSFLRSQSCDIAAAATGLIAIRKSNPRWSSSSSIIELADLTKSGKTHWCRCVWCMRRKSPFIVVSSTPDDQKCSR